MNPAADVFFWATVATATIVLEIVVFIPRRSKRKVIYAISGIAAITLFELPRFIIPMLPQPSIGLEIYEAKIAGLSLFALGISIMIISFIQLMIAKRENWKLQTSGIYGIVRHPMYLGDVLWSVGWSIAFNALYALLLTPLWLFLRYSLAVLEEEKLLEKYGREYEDYMRKVPRRMIPFIL